MERSPCSLLTIQEVISLITLPQTYLVRPQNRPCSFSARQSPSQRTLPQVLHQCGRASEGPKPFLIHWGGPRRSLREVEIQGDLRGRIPGDQMEHSDVLEHPCRDDEQLQRGQQGQVLPPPTPSAVALLPLTLGSRGQRQSGSPAQKRKIYKLLLYTKQSSREEQSLVSARSRTANQNRMLFFTD